MKKLSIVSAVFMMFFSVSFQSIAAHAEDAIPSLCTPGEAVIFSCPVSKTKVLSICSSKQYSADSGYVQYRFGPVGKPEMVVPSSKTAPSQSAQSGTWMFSGGGGAYMQFVNKKTTYSVYSAVGKWGANGETVEKTGVAVESKGKIVANILCKGPSTSELGPEVFDNMGLKMADPEFELPE